MSNNRRDCCRRALQWANRESVSQLSSRPTGAVIGGRPLERRRVSCGHVAWHSRNKNGSPSPWGLLDTMLPHVPLYRTTQDPPITYQQNNTNTTQSAQHERDTACFRPVSSSPSWRRGFQQHLSRLGTSPASYPGIWEKEKPSGAPLLVPTSGHWDPRSRRAGGTTTQIGKPSLAE